jgi:hypothetical protein
MIYNVPLDKFIPILESHEGGIYLTLSLKRNTLDYIILLLNKEDLLNSLRADPGVIKSVRFSLHDGMKRNTKSMSIQKFFV